MIKFFVALSLMAGLSANAQDTLKTVKVTIPGRSIRKSVSAITNVETMTSKALLKAACCNLAESFESNPSIDVSFSDAITGTRQIKMLGLTSPYLMITEENIPSVRGASQTYGLSFTPGDWVESIQITKGAGSVVNGYESISGQINTELVKPVNDLPFFFNLYSGSDSRLELNSHISRKISDKWSSSLLIHGNSRLAKNDMNNDGFLDNPLQNQINVMNRWQYQNLEKGWVSFLSFRFLNDEKQAGQINFDPQKDKFTTNYWGSEIKTKRYDLATKLGYVFPDAPYQSIGFQNAFSSHKQNSYFGFSTYDISQESYYSNLIFNSIIDNTKHKVSGGLNFRYDRYREQFEQNYDRIDNSVGAFFEYTYDNNDKLGIVAGLRADEHNRLGAFLTPRLHIRYNPWEKAVIRLSGGRGKRIANIFAENQQIFLGPEISVLGNQSGKTYGLNPEIAWNYGMSFNQKFYVFGMAADAGFDLYRTDFKDQVVVDWYSSANAVSFYNLEGSSFVNSFQIDFNLQPLPRLNVHSAYKYYDSQTRYLSGNFETPLQPRQRFFVNSEYATEVKTNGENWKFDATYNWLGKQKLPLTTTSMNQGLPGFSPNYSLLNAQITKVFSTMFEIYAGGENLGDYKQNKSVLGADDPFGENFNASVVYAPIFGAMYYAGIRLKIK